MFVCLFSFQLQILCISLLSFINLDDESKHDLKTKSQELEAEKREFEVEKHKFQVEMEMRKQSMKIFITDYISFLHVLLVLVIMKFCTIRYAMQCCYVTVKALVI